MSGDYRYTIIDFAPLESAEYGRLRLEPTEHGPRLRVPKRRQEYDEEVAALLLEVQRLRAQQPDRPDRKAPAAAPRHGVFDVRATGRREYWTQGSLDRSVPSEVVDRMSRRPWGAYPDYNDAA